MKKRKQVVVEFKVRPLVFEIEAEKINPFLFGIKKKKQVKK
jgi:hypothetical protein